MSITKTVARVYEQGERGMGSGFAETAAHGINHVEKHPEKTDAKIRM